MGLLLPTVKGSRKSLPTKPVEGSLNPGMGIEPSSLHLHIWYHIYRVEEVSSRPFFSDELLVNALIEEFNDNVLRCDALVSLGN